MPNSDKRFIWIFIAIVVAATLCGLLIYGANATPERLLDDLYGIFIH